MVLDVYFHSFYDFFYKKEEKNAKMFGEMILFMYLCIVNNT